LTVDGCTDHAVTAEVVADWWKVVEARDSLVSMCACCGGPCPLESPVCKFCLTADLEALKWGTKMPNLIQSMPSDGRGIG